MKLNTAETASKLYGELGCKTANGAYVKLTSLRRKGEGPPCYKTGTGPTCQVIYEHEDVLEWIRAKGIHAIHMGERN